MGGRFRNRSGSPLSSKGMAAYMRCRSRPRILPRRSARAVRAFDYQCARCHLPAKRVTRKYRQQARSFGGGYRFGRKEMMLAPERYSAVRGREVAASSATPWSPHQNCLPARSYARDKRYGRLFELIARNDCTIFTGAPESEMCTAICCARATGATSKRCGA